MCGIRSGLEALLGLKPNHAVQENHTTVPAPSYNLLPSYAKVLPHRKWTCHEQT